LLAEPQELTVVAVVAVLDQSDKLLPPLMVGMVVPA
jgi:hypothetical protein